MVPACLDCTWRNQVVFLGFFCLDVVEYLPYFVVICKNEKVKLLLAAITVSYVSERHVTDVGTECMNRLLTSCFTCLY